MASKSKLKRLASARRQKEHELQRVMKEKDKELKRLGIHPDQIEARKAKINSTYQYRRRKDTSLEPVVRTGVYRQETPNYPSVVSKANVHVAEKKTKTSYTGDKLIGLATMHKSNLVPIFNEEHAKDVSAMRRN